MKKEMSKAGFDLLVTEISTHNKRSSRAHQKVGFEIVKIYEDENGEPWELVVWPLK